MPSTCSCLPVPSTRARGAEQFASSPPDVTCNTCDVELMRSPLEYQNEMFLKRRPALSVESRVKAQTEVFMPMVSGAS